MSWEWDFGDGSTSTERNPVHTYAARGNYAVTLTVTDSQGLSGTVIETVQVLPPPPVLEIDRVTRIRERFEFRVNLVWSGAEGDLVELHRNFNIVDLPDNDGAHRDKFRSLQTSFRWFVCELGIDQCSNEVVLDVGGPNSLEATVTTENRRAEDSGEGADPRRVGRQHPRASFERQLSLARGSCNSSLRVSRLESRHSERRQGP